MESFEPFAGYYFFNAMLMVLQALHIFWAWLILRMVYKFLKGNVRRAREPTRNTKIGRPSVSDMCCFYFSIICQIKTDTLD